jgi:ribonucleoside-diphosphate reductase alpha chain
VFDCAFKAYRGQRSMSYMAHLKMMGATQPFISGAISKTVNLPHHCTVADIKDAYIQAWKMGLKCVAIYRDGSKRSQPLNTKKTNEGAADVAVARVKELEAEIAKLQEQTGQPLRRRLPDTRTAVTHKFEIAGHEGYLTVGLFENGQPGELFITMAKEGSTIGGLMDSIGTLTSLALQYGVPLDALIKKFAHQRFEPSGFTRNPDIRNASSIIDYVFRWLGHQFVPGYPDGGNGHGGGARTQSELPMPGLVEEVKKKITRPVPDLPVNDDSEFITRPGREIEANANGNGNGNGHAHVPAVGRPADVLSQSVAHFQQDAPTCPKCGHVAVRNGACFKCLNCGESLGCS